MRVLTCRVAHRSAKDWTQQVWAGRVDVNAKGAGCEIKLINPNGSVTASGLAKWPGL